MWHDYLRTQFDPAHLLSELGFSMVFELAQVAFLAMVWRRTGWQRITKAHVQFDTEHNLTHETEREYA